MTEPHLDADISRDENVAVSRVEVPAAATPAAPSSRLGQRLRALRLAAGLTQSQVAGDRFSKEYISQIERGKTRPTQESVAWLARQLDVDPVFLGSGVSNDLRSRVEAALARAEALTESGRTAEAIEAFASARQHIGPTGSAELEVRAFSGEAWARMSEGDARTALELLLVARELAEGPQFSDVDRADILFRLGACRFALSSTSTAAALLDEALALAASSGLPCDLLCANILGWRSRCRRRQRHYEAAREDAAAALELAQRVESSRVVADRYYLASLDAEKSGHTVASRTYGLRAKAIYEELNERRNVGRLMLDLGSLQNVLHSPEQAKENMEASVVVAVDADSPRDAARALRSLAAVHLQLEEYEAADASARKALALLEGRDDAPVEVGESNLLLGRALLERGRLEEAEERFLAADAVFEPLASVAHRAGAWIARGDLARARGEDGEAARLYRIAAEALQDIRF